MKASELLTVLRQIQEAGVDLAETDVELYDHATSSSIEIDDLGFTGDGVLQIKFDYEG